VENAAVDTKGRDAAFKTILLEMGRVRSVEPLLRLIVDRLFERPHVALARIWLRKPGDICDRCFLREECADRTECLHLVASAGASLSPEDGDWSSLDGHFRRFPFGARKIGHVAATGGPIEVEDVQADAKWLARPEWALAEGIHGFGAQPLLYEDQVLGVLGVFTRTTMERAAFEWLRMLADHAAGAIANARAFEEIERLKGELELENEYLREEVRAHLGTLIGHGPAMHRLVEQIDLVAVSDATVLVTGESGTGKELVAHEIHTRSARSAKPLIKVNCAAVPRDLFESEFFGHARGAFTGATKDRAGRFAAADGGTLFLDEVGEIPLDLQGKLLRVLQEKQYERVGEERTRPVDVRVVAATNRDLAADVEAGRFRRDLYYRLHVFPIEVVPLRERGEDLPVLAEHFLERAARKLDRPVPRLTREHVAQLGSYSWPGNVRELINVIERAVITARGRKMRIVLPQDAPIAVPVRTDPGDVLTQTEFRSQERANLLAALEQARWKVSGPGGAAELLGVPPTTLQYRMRKFGLRRPRD